MSEPTRFDELLGDLIDEHGLDPLWQELEAEHRRIEAENERLRETLHVIEALIGVAADLAVQP